MPVQIRQEHVSAGCNRSVGALAWGGCGLVAYAAHHQVVICDVQAAEVQAVLVGHSSPVNCITWLPQPAVEETALSDDTHALVSGSADGTVTVWLVTLQQEEQPWSLHSQFQGHGAAITCLTALHLQEEQQLLLISTGGDACTQVRHASLGRQEAASSEQQQGPLAAWQLAQQIRTGLQMQQAAAVARLPDEPECLLLALGGVDLAVRLLLREPGQDFQEQCLLPGPGDWVRSLTFSPSQADSVTGRRQLLLACAAQDKCVRVWQIEQERSASDVATGGKQTADAMAGNIARYAPRSRLRTKHNMYQAGLQGLLVGHEDWVHSVMWQPGVGHQEPCLLSSSMDRTMMLWRRDADTGLWTSEESVGNAGATNLGYYGGVFSPDGTAILAHGFTGALHLWRSAGGAVAQPGMQQGWEPQHALGGHTGAVVDMAWGVDGKCLLSASADQTLRITAQCQSHWCELARPQIWCLPGRPALGPSCRASLAALPYSVPADQVHGHDFSCLASLPCSTGGQHRYASGAEEKVIRVFEAPQAFLESLASASGQDMPEPTVQGLHQRPLGAAVAALGLSNKAVYEDDDPAGGADNPGGYTEGPDLAPTPAPSAVQGPPLEEHLAQNTLWPEICKLYGHGNQLFCMAADPQGKLLASACKAQSASSAAIWLWDTTTWAPVGQLLAHTLTVTQLAFSPDGFWLLSASRDRTFALFKRDDAVPGGTPFSLLGRVKAHARILWGIAWSSNNALFATAARDCTVKLWRPENCAGAGSKALACLPAFPSAATALAMAQGAHPECHLLAVGLETGEITLWSVSAAITTVTCLWRAPVHLQHGAAVRKLAFQELDQQTDSDSRTLHLASCSDDHTVRTLSVRL